MNAFEITYDGSARTLEVPDTALVTPRVPEAVEPLPHPVQWEALGEAIEDCQRLLVVINDAYRPTPTAAVLQRLQGPLQAAGEVRLVVATGMHSPPDPAWLDSVLADLPDGCAMEVHDADAPGYRFDVIETGTVLELNPLLSWAERILLIGSVEPHFFAGFTGGAKQILPGLATRETIEANHCHAIDAGCRPLHLDDNPVARGILEALFAFIERIISVQATRGPEGWEYFCGPEPLAFMQAAARCAQRACIRWPEPLDALVAVVAPPLDRNLYQLQKGFENHRDAVRAGGHLLLVSACRDGIGNEFFGPLADQYPDWQALPPWEEQTYSLGLHKLYRTAQARKSIHLELFSSLPDGEARRFYLEPVDDPDHWIRQRIDSEARVGIVHDAGHTVSVLDANT